MKSVVLFISFFLTIQLYGQKRYDFDFTGKSLDEVVEVLSGKHKFKFSYNPKILKPHVLDRRIKANSEAELISKIFEDLPFKIQISHGIYLVIPGKLENKPTSLAGKIYDKDTGKPLAFAHVQSSAKGTVSNQDGKFVLPPRTDTITIQVSYIGYKDLELMVPPTQDIVDLNLEQNPHILKEVILSGSQYLDLAGQTSFSSLDPEKFSALPNLGETDVFKSIQLLPGIKATDESSSGLSVRGGTPAQNLILMDGFTLYHLDHFFGIFSTVNPNVIDNVSVYKGGFGPEYGGRVSSVVDVTGKVGSTEKFAAGVGVNLLSANAFLETPIGKKSSLLIGGRKSFNDILNSNLYQDFLTSNRKGFLNAVNPDIASLEIEPAFEFYDFNGKFTHEFSTKSSLDVNLYLSEDFYNGSFSDEDSFSSYNVTDEAGWSNAGLSIGLQQNFSSKWSANFTFSASEYAKNESLRVTETIFDAVSFGLTELEANAEIAYLDYGINSSVGDLTFRADHQVQLDDQNMVKFGAELSSINTFYESDEVFFLGFSDDSLSVDILDTTYTDTLNIEAAISSFYAGYQFRNEILSTNIGLRGSFYEPTSQWYIEPRFDLRVKVGDHLHLKSAASYHHQFVNQTSLSAFQSQDQFYLTLADEDVIPIQKSAHLILGADYTTGNWSFDIEYYRKNTKGIIENQFLTLVPESLNTIEEENLNLSGENSAQGLDLFVKYRTDRYTSWLSYSLSESENQFWYRNDNNLYPSALDQRHEVNLVNLKKLGKWELSSIFILGSGRPFTPPNQEVFGESIYDLSQINQERLPNYSRLDLSAKYSFAIGSSKCETGVTLFNLLDHSNVKSRRYSRQYFFDENSSNDSITEDEVRIVALDTRLLGFTPNFFLNIRF